MARSSEGAELTQMHRDQQIAVRAAAQADVSRMWPVFNPDRLHSFDEFLDAAEPVVVARHAQSAQAGAEYYSRFRDAEGVPGRATPMVASQPDGAALRTGMRAAGYFGTLRAVAAGMSRNRALETGLVHTLGSVSSAVLSGGRDSVVGSIRQDRRAQGWQRATAANPCSFCAMVASRGPIFSEEQAAGFQPHDHCACTPEPYYRGSSPVGRNEEFAEEWSRAQNLAREEGTLEAGTTNDALNAFRRYRERGAVS